MSVAVALWLILVLVFVAFLAGHGRGRRRGRHEMAVLVEAKYGPLLAQLEELATTTERLGAELSGETKRHVDERIDAMRKASPFN